MTDYCGYEDAPDVHREVMRTARKHHRCCECGGAIGFGDRYEHASTLYEGHWDSYKTCLDCVDGPRAYVMRNCGCWIFECVEEHLRDVFHDHEFESAGSRFGVGRMLIEMRRRRRGVVL